MLLLLDKMHIREDLVCDKHSGALVGFTVVNSIAKPPKSGNCRSEGKIQMSAKKICHYQSIPAKLRSDMFMQSSYVASTSNGINVLRLLLL